MNPIDLLPPAAAISLANPEPNEPLQEVVGQSEALDEELARLALFEALARMLSVPGADSSSGEPACNPMAGLFGMLLDGGTTDSPLAPRSMTG